MCDQLPKNELSPHPHLAVHKHGEQPVEEGGGLVLLVIGEDEGIGFRNNSVKGTDNLFFGWICELQGAEIVTVDGAERGAVAVSSGKDLLENSENLEQK